MRVFHMITFWISFYAVVDWTGSWLDTWCSEGAMGAYLTLVLCALPTSTVLMAWCLGFYDDMNGCDMLTRCGADRSGVTGGPAVGVSGWATQVAGISGFDSRPRHFNPNREDPPDEDRNLQEAARR